MSYPQLGAACPPCHIEFAGECEPCPPASEHLVECQGCRVVEPTWQIPRVLVHVGVGVAVVLGLSLVAAALGHQSVEERWFV
jgi:hypothetical protein